MLLDHCPAIRGDVLFDPTCGDGRMARELVRRWRFIVAELNDIDRKVAANTHLDCLDERLWSARRCDLVITNPPFSRGGELARRALAAARSGVAFFIRLSFL